jgi:3-oxoacyl-[acyl-carrier protein] reductase
VPRRVDHRALHDVARAIVAGITHLTSSTGIIVTVDEGRHL